MCQALIRPCSCGAGLASIHNRDALLPQEVIVTVHCPQCRYEFDELRMVKDNGWAIEYDMELARHFLHTRLPGEEITPQRLFDEGWSSWNGLTPTDAWDKNMEMNQLAAATLGDPKLYLLEFRAWTLGRVERLATEGWRKAQAA